MKLRLLTAFAVTALSIGDDFPGLGRRFKVLFRRSVKEVTAIRTKPGMFDTYMKWLDTTGKQLREEEKKAGLILDFEVYAAMPRSPHDPDLYMVITYKNMAALDGLDDRFEPIRKEPWATRDAAAKADIDRESMREILGTELIRRLDLK